ncbi:MAG: TraR/DksA family transcriptional regulator [Spirochaetaceae bacterium]
MAATTEDREFYARQRERLEEMREVLVEKVILETTEYNELFKDLNAKDSAEIAREFEDQETVGILADIDRNRLKRIFWALYRLDHGNYVICQKCGGKISRGRLNAMPATTLCIECKAKAEREARQRGEPV